MPSRSDARTRHCEPSTSSRLHSNSSRRPTARLNSNPSVRLGLKPDSWSRSSQCSLSARVTRLSETVSIRPSDIREFKRLDASYDTDDYDNPAPFGYYSKTIHRPYTAVILWSTKQINVVDTVEEIQEKIQQNIERLCKIQAQILADAARKED